MFVDADYMACSERAVHSLTPPEKRVFRRLRATHTPRRYCVSTFSPKKLTLSRPFQPVLITAVAGSGHCDRYYFPTVLFHFVANL